MNLSTINKITVERSSKIISDIFLTIDIDWAHDEILLYTIEILEENMIVKIMV